MVQLPSALWLCAGFFGCLLVAPAGAAEFAHPQISNSSEVVEAAPTLAPFQHVRFCLRYPGECRSNPAEDDHIVLTNRTRALLRTVNDDVNAAIIPRLKTYGSNLHDGWSIDPVSGDCNDYAVTKRHQLLQHGLPARALRLSVVRTRTGIGHLVLLVATTDGDLVLDNLTRDIRSWQNTNYQWIKIQSAADARLWSTIQVSRRTDQPLRLADRSSGTTN
jgi:predicted transglutaminase-like cysteine proteinase